MVAYQVSVPRTNDIAHDEKLIVSLKFDIYLPPIVPLPQDSCGSSLGLLGRKGCNRS